MQHGWISESYLSERIQTQRPVHYMVPFTWNSRTGKLISSDRKQISDYLGLHVAEGWTVEGQEETSRNVKNVLYLKRDRDFIAVYLHQNLPHIYTLNWCIWWSLYLSNSDFLSICQIQPKKKKKYKLAGSFSLRKILTVQPGLLNVRTESVKEKLTLWTWLKYWNRSHRK